MPTYFDFYTYVGNIAVTYNIYYMTKKGVYMYKRGDCINHFYYRPRRISEQDYINAYEEYKGY